MIWTAASPAIPESRILGTMRSSFTSWHRPIHSSSQSTRHRASPGRTAPAAPASCAPRLRFHGSALRHRLQGSRKVRLASPGQLREFRERTRPLPGNQFQAMPVVLGQQLRKALDRGEPHLRLTLRRCVLATGNRPGAPLGAAAGVLRRPQAPPGAPFVASERARASPRDVERRTVMVAARVSPTELADWQVKAAAIGVPLSALLRQAMAHTRMWTAPAAAGERER